MDMLDRRGVTIQPGDEVCSNAFQGVALRPLPDGWYEVAVGGVPAPVLPFELEVVARWHPCRQGAGFSTLRLRPGDRVHMRDDPRMFVVLDAVVGRGVIPIGLADAGPMVPAVWEVEEKKLSLAEPYPVLEPYVDRHGNRLVQGDVVEVGIGVQTTRIAVGEISAANQAYWAREALLVKPRKPEYLDLYGRPLLLGDIVWRDGVQYRLATVAHGKLRPVDVFPVLDGDRGRPLRVVADRVAAAKATWKKAYDYAHSLAAEALERQQASSAPQPLDTWKSAAIGGTPFRINASPDADKFLTTSAVVHPDGPRPSTLTEGEAGALAALGKLGLAVEWGLCLAVLDHGWRKVHRRASLSWDVVGVGSPGTVLDDPSGVLVTLGMEGLDPCEGFLPFEDVQPARRKSAKKTKGVKGVTNSPAPEPGTAPFVELDPFAWDETIPPHLAAPLVSPWSSSSGGFVQGFTLGAPSSPLRREPAYQRAFDLIRSARINLRADMARHYTPPAPEVRPRRAIVDEFLGGMADGYFRRVEPDEDGV